MNAIPSLSALGSPDIARSIARRVIKEVPGYRAFLTQKETPFDTPFSKLPLIDKTSYLSQVPFHQLTGGDFDQTFHIFSSSGSSGHPFYWPQLKESHLASSERLRTFLENIFSVHEKRTLAIVGLALGSWIGGDHFSWLLKSVAIRTPYPLAVFSPGNKHQEIINMLLNADPFVDQFILACCPSAIAHIILRAEQAGQSLPLHKMRFIVIGEPFPETLRSHLEERAKITPDQPLMLSIYGSADTGVLSVESPASISLRKLCAAEPGIAAELGFNSVIPHFFHQVDPAAYLEAVENQLCVTKWQGIPLVRYNLHDHATLFTWSAIAQRFPAWEQKYPQLAPILQRLANAKFDEPLTNLIAITGRADSCLILCGTNLSEAMFDEAIRSPDLETILTGPYQAKLLLEEGRQRLELTLEFRPERGTPEHVTELVYPKLIEALSRVQPEFKDDWTSIYSTWDTDPLKRILKLEMVAGPTLSNGLESKIKQRGIVR